MRISGVQKLLRLAAGYTQCSPYGKAEFHVDPRASVYFLPDLDASFEQLDGTSVDFFEGLELDFDLAEA